VSIRRGGVESASRANLERDVRHPAGTDDRIEPAVWLRWRHCVVLALKLLVILDGARRRPL
jgi:hypothetical protein